MASSIPPTSGPHPSQFALGGKNHIAYELWQQMIEFRTLIGGYPQDLKKLEKFLGNLQKFLDKNKEQIIQQSEKNGWQPEDEFNTAISMIKNFLQNPHGGEGPLFMLNEALPHMHSFLVQMNVH